MNFSVLMSIYCKESPEFFAQALSSIWYEQSIKPSEIVLVKDGPLTFELEAVINKYAKLLPLKIIALPENKGLGIALSEGLVHCTNDLVARMDGDDIAAPNRFLKQIEYFEQNPEISLLSSNIAEFELTPALIKSIRKVPQTHSEIVRFAKRRNPMNHMAIMFRKSAVLYAGSYQPFHGYEDYYLWVRMFLAGFRAANSNENLVFARIGNNMIARRQGLRFFKEELRLQGEFINIGFINRLEWVQNILLRAFPRLMPIFALKLIYRTLRK